MGWPRPGRPWRLTGLLCSPWEVKSPRNNALKWLLSSCKVRAMIPIGHVRTPVHLLWLYLFAIRSDYSAEGCSLSERLMKNPTWTQKATRDKRSLGRRLSDFFLRGSEDKFPVCNRRVGGGQKFRGQHRFFESVGAALSRLR